MIQAQRIFWWFLLLTVFFILSFFAFAQDDEAEVDSMMNEIDSFLDNYWYGNNDVSKTGSVDLPDLYVNDIYHITKGNRVLHFDENTPILVRVCAKPEMTASRQVTVGIQVNGGPMYKTSQTQRLTESTCFAVTATYQGLGISLPGQYTINVSVDPDHTIAESQEYNNTSSKSITVSFDTPTPTPIKPDLFVDTVSFHKEEKKLTANVCWEDSGLETPVTIPVQLSVNGGTYEDTKTLELNKKGCKAYDILVSDLPVGKHKGSILVDPKKTLEELHRTNNSKSVTLLVEGPKPTPVSTGPQPWNNPELLKTTPSDIDENSKKEDKDEFNFVETYDLLQLYCEYEGNWISTCTQLYGLNSLRSNIHEIMTTLILSMNRRYGTDEEKARKIAQYRKNINKLTVQFHSADIRQNTRIAFIFAYIDYGLGLYEAALKGTHNDIITTQKFFSAIF